MWWSATRGDERIAMLIDAKAVLSAIAKGRTGFSAFRRTLASLNAHLLAADILLRPVYIPSEDNPADAPSRGVRMRAPRRIARGTRDVFASIVTALREAGFVL